MLASVQDFWRCNHYIAIAADVKVIKLELQMSPENVILEDRKGIITSQVLVEGTEQVLQYSMLISAGARREILLWVSI